jgi:16S rRNA G966 N2-methylase RsmD
MVKKLGTKVWNWLKDKFSGLTKFIMSNNMVDQNNKPVFKNIWSTICGKAKGLVNWKKEGVTPDQLSSVGNKVKLNEADKYDISDEEVKYYGFFEKVAHALGIKNARFNGVVSQIMKKGTIGVAILGLMKVCGFSLAAIAGEATLAHSLDSSKKAIELTEANVLLNDMGKNHQSIVADTMEYIKELPEAYDIIILDPPAFAKHKDKRHKAIQGYKRLNAHAIRQIKPGGLIFTYSCSQVVDKSLFTNTIIAAAIESGRKVRILEQLHQPADHPINAFHPEGEYLKGLVIQVE